MRLLTVDLIGQVHIDTISIMEEDDLLFEFQVSGPALSLLVKSVDEFLRNWPGGDANEQLAAFNMQCELRKAYLEYQFLEGDIT